MHLALFVWMDDYPHNRICRYTHLVNIGTSLVKASMDDSDMECPIAKKYIRTMN